MKLSRLFLPLLLTSIGACTIIRNTPPQDQSVEVAPEPQEVEVTQQEAPTPTPQQTSYSLSPAVKQFCDQLSQKFNTYGWGEPNCEEFNWHHVRNTDLGTPLIWTSFGEEQDPKSKA